MNEILRKNCRAAFGPKYLTLFGASSFLFTMVMGLRQRAFPDITAYSIAAYSFLMSFVLLTIIALAKTFRETWLKDRLVLAPVILILAAFIFWALVTVETDGGATANWFAVVEGYVLYFIYGLKNLTAVFNKVTEAEADAA